METINGILMGVNAVVNVVLIPSTYILRRIKHFFSVKYHQIPTYQGYTLFLAHLTHLAHKVSL